MKPTRKVACVAMALVISALALAQVPNESLANAIVAARQRNQAKLRQFQWNSRVEILDQGKMADLRIELVSVGADDRVQRQVLNNEPGKVPGLFLRKAIGQAQQTQAEESAAQLGDLVEQYTVSSAGRVAAFVMQSQPQPITTAQGQSLLQLTGSSVLLPGDTLTLVVSGSTLLPVSAQISTTFNGNPATISATFVTLGSGLNALQYATAEVPAKHLQLLVHNYDFVPVD